MSALSELKFSVLGSGSAGNCVYVQGGGVSILVDAGLSARETQSRLQSLGVNPAQIDLVLLTHEHGDHAHHAGRLSRAFDCPLAATEGTFRETEKWLKGDEERILVKAGQSFSFGGLEIHPVAKPHDGREPVAYLLGQAGLEVGVFTDLGHVDAVVGEAMRRCSAMVFEANHDPRLLAAGPYPPSLKARVGGRLGHLSNEDSAAALRRYAGPGLREVVLAHLSSTNNTTAHAKAASLRVLGETPGYTRRFSLQEKASPLLRVALGD